LLSALATATEQLERAWQLDHDFAHPAMKYDPALQRAVKKYRSAHPSPVRITAAANKIDPVAAILDTVSTELRSIWTKMIRRTAYLDQILAVTRFNHPGRGAVVEDDADAVLTRVLPGLHARLTDGATFAAAAWADGHAAAAARLLPTALAEARKALNESADDRIAAADRIRTLQWVIAAMRVVQWRCLWPHVGDAASLVEAASLPIRPAVEPAARTPQALTRRQPRSGSAVTVVGRVDDLAITHERNKPITRFRLVSEDGIASVLVKVTGFKVDSTGMVAGADAVVTGTWRREGGKGELLLGRTSLAARRKESFDGFLESEIRDVWLCVPHSLSMRFGWVKGFDGPLNPVRYKVGHDG